MGTYTWSGSGGGNWSTAASNWTSSGGTTGAWANGENQAVFTGSGGTIALDPGISAHGLSVATGAMGYTFAGGSLILTGSGIVANESVTINSSLTVGAPQSWNVAAGKQLTIGGPVDLNISPLTVASAGTTIINGSIGDVRSDPLLGSAWAGQVGSLTITGSGTLILGGSDTFSGATALQGGVLHLANAAALQNSTLNLSGGQLSLDGVTSIALGGLSGNVNFSLTNTAGQAVNLTVGNNSVSATYSGVLSGGGALVKTGSGVLTLTGNNTFVGGLAISDGTLSVPVWNESGTSGPFGAAAGGIGMGDASGDAGVLAYSGSSVVTARSFTLAAGGGGFLLPSSSTTLTLTSPIDGAGGLSLSGSGTLVLAGSNSYQGVTNLNGGKIVVASPDAFGSSTALDFNGGGLQFAAVADPSAATMTFNARQTILDTNGYNITFSNPIGGGGAGGIYKKGAGTLTLAGSGNFTGGVFVGGGALDIESGFALAATSFVDVFSGAALELQGGITMSAGRMINLLSTGVANDGGVRNLSGSNTITTQVWLGAAAQNQF